ncbi:MULTISPECIES: integrase [unclassified Streptomyces]
MNQSMQKCLGHSKPSVTLDACTHLWPDGVDTAWAAVAVALGDVP